MSGNFPTSSSSSSTSVFMICEVSIDVVGRRTLLPIRSLTWDHSLGLSPVPTVGAVVSGYRRLAGPPIWFIRREAFVLVFFYKLYNDKNRKSYISSANATLSLIFFFLKNGGAAAEIDEALKWQRWSMTAIEGTASLTNGPITPDCGAELDRPPLPSLSLSLARSVSAEDECVCVWPMTE